MTWIEFVIFGLATWRISSLLVNEDGPFGAFLKIRIWAGIHHDENGKQLEVPERFFAKLLSCVWCSSVWVGFGWVTAYFFFPKVAEIFALGFALSTGAIVIQAVLDR